MNENNQNNTGNITPYKAAGNLNTVIGNPSVNINDPMNVNIQNIATNQVPVNNVKSTEIVQNKQNISNQQQPVDTSRTINENNVVVPNVNNANSGQQINNQSSHYVNKTYVTVNNKPKKKNIQLKLGSEFKIALLIMVILMIFIFLLPKINELFRGY